MVIFLTHCEFRNLAYVTPIRHMTLSDGREKICLLPQQLYVSSLCRMTGFDVTIGQCAVSDGNLECAIDDNDNFFDDGNSLSAN